MPIHFDSSRLLEALDAHDRWWKGELDRPLVSIKIDDAYAPSHEAKTPYLSQANCNDFSILPEQIIDTYDSHMSRIEFLGDSYPHVNFDVFGPGLVAAFCGARLRNDTGAVWFEPSEKKDISEIHAKYDPDNIWSKRVKDIYRAGLERWNGSVIMGLPDLGGTLDIAASLCGNEELLFAIIEQPDEVKRLSDEIHTAWYEAYKDFETVLAPQKAYTHWSLLLSSKPSYIIQCDFSTMISEDMFEEFALEGLKADTKTLTNTIYHLDGVGALRHLDNILALEELNAVQWIPGAGQPGPTHWLDVYRKIMDAGKQMQILGKPEEFIDTVKQIHGTPYYNNWLLNKDREVALAALNVR